MFWALLLCVLPGAWRGEAAGSPWVEILCVVGMLWVPCSSIVEVVCFVFFVGWHPNLQLATEYGTGLLMNMEYKDS